MRHIFGLLVAAKIASDAGKGFQREYYKTFAENTVLGKRAVSEEYAAKDAYILEAINLLLKEKPQDVRFLVVKNDEPCIKAEYVVYFDLDFSGWKTQVSFHSRDARLGKFIRRGGSRNWIGTYGRKETEDTDDVLRNILRRFYK